MTHNMTVTVEDTLWSEMKKYSEIRWSAVMKDAAKEKLKALSVLDNLMKKTKLSDAEIDSFALKLGKRINNKE